MAVERTISLIKSGILAAGLSGGIALSAYRELKRPESNLRGMVLDGVATRINYPQGNQSEIDSFLLQIPGPLGSAGIAAEILAQPHRPWLTGNVLRTSLARGPEEFDVFCLEVKPADQDKFCGLYILREIGDPTDTYNIPRSEDTISIATVRFFLAGRKHIPTALIPATDTSE